MPWAQTDDGFHDHPKVMELLTRGLDGLAAIGLWELALSWSHRHTRHLGPDRAGHVPTSLVYRLAGEHGPHLAGLLVEARAGSGHGLWEIRSDGWQFHDFWDWQQLAARLAKADGGRRSGETRRAQSAAKAQATKPDRRVFEESSKSPPNSGPPRGAKTGPRKTAGHEVTSKSASNPQPKVGVQVVDTRTGSNPAKTVTSTDAEQTNSASGAKPRRQQRQHQPNVGDVVAAYVEGAEDAGLKRPPSSLCARVGRQARQLLADGYALPDLIAAARTLGAGEWNDLSVQVRKDQAAARPRPHDPIATHGGWQP